MNREDLAEQSKDKWFPFKNAPEDFMEERGKRGKGIDQKRNAVKNKIEKTSQPSQETRRIKNQAEIDRVNAENEKRTERNERKLEEEKRIRQAVEGALVLVSKKLGDKSLTEKQRERLAWVAKSVKDASNNLEKSSYKVEVKDGSRILASRIEALPLEGLIKETAIEIEKLKIGIRDIEQQIALHTNAKTNKLGEVEKKTEWKKVFENIPANGELKKKIIAKMSAWRQADEANGAKYDQAKIDEQLGEACFQVLRDFTESQIELLKKKEGENSAAVERYTKLLNTMAGASSNYFRFHYKKASRELTKIEQQTQDLYTKREANLISKDSAYRNMLLEAHGKRLPKNFNEMNKERQNYELAMLALDNRLILNLPGELEELEKVPEPVYEVVKPTTVPEKIPDTQPNHKLQNTNEPYDIENLAFSIPENVKLPEKADKRIFLIDISEIAKRMAWSKAEEKLRKEFDHSGGKLGKWVKNAWKGLSENYKRIKYYQEALTEIQTDNNLMRAISERASGQPIPGGGTRVSNEYLEILDSVVAEYKHEVADAQREVGDSLKDDPEIKGKFAELLHRYRTNKWDGAQYQGLDKRACVELYVKEYIAPYINKQSTAKWTQDIDRLKEAKGLLYASNFYEMLESIDNQYKGQIDQAVKDVLDKNPEANIEAVRNAIAEHVSGVQGLELQLGVRDRDLVNNRPKGILNFMEKVQGMAEGTDYENQSVTKTKALRVIKRVLLNPFVVGTAATLAGNGVQRAIKWAAVGGALAAGATGFAVPLGVGALAGGAYRAFKRSKDIKYDTAQELRHQTLGGKPSEVLGANNERNYGTAIMAFSEALAQVGAMKNKTNFSDAEKQQLAQIYARLQLEHDTLVSNKKDEVRLDLFKTDEESGKKYGTTAVEKSKLKVELKKLGISEQALQTLIDQEKGKLVQIILDVNKEQDSFRRKEMLKSGVLGAVMGVAGGVIGQQAGYELARLFGSDYMNTHGTMLEKALGLKHGLFGNAGGDKIISPAMVVPGSGIAKTSTEWFHNIRGHVTGGAVENIHTQNWYDNPDMSDPHIHNSNELQFHISKDASEAFHFKVPVEENKSWLVHGTTMKYADVPKAFADGRIKMIFVPDGAHPENAVVLDVDPSTKEVIIPKGSNLRALFDEKTGRPKGTGFFGLAERQGTSKNYIWINSERNNGQDIDWGKNAKPGKVLPAVFGKNDVTDYDGTIPTVPPERKVFLRPEEKAVIDEKKKKKEEKATQDTIGILTNANAGVAQVNSRAGILQESVRNPEPNEAQEAELEERLREENKDLLKLERITQLRRAYQFDLSPEQKKSLGVDFQKIKQWKIFEDKFIKKAKEADEKELHEKYGKELKGQPKGYNNEVKYVVIHYESPTTEEYINELKKLEKSVEGIEKKYKKIEELNESIKKILNEEDTEHEGDIDDLTQEFEDLTGEEWSKDFDFKKYKKTERAKLRKFSKESEASKTPAQAAAEKTPAPTPTKPEQPAQAKDKVPEGSFKVDNEEIDNVRLQEGMNQLAEDFHNKTKRHIHFNVQGDHMPAKDMLKVMETFGRAAELMSDSAKRWVGSRFNRNHKDDPKLAKGIIFGFPANATRLQFNRANDNLEIPPNTTPEQLKEFLEQNFKLAEERRKARLEQREAGGITEGKETPGAPQTRPQRTYAQGRQRKTQE